jgi:AraC-like DNA-binding protein
MNGWPRVEWCSPLPVFIITNIKIEVTETFRAVRQLTDYINKLRIEEAKKMLWESDMKVAGIAFECGFNSLSTFYLFSKNPQAYPLPNSGNNDENLVFSQRQFCFSCELRADLVTAGSVTLPSLAFLIFESEASFLKEPQR